MRGRRRFVLGWVVGLLPVLCLGQTGQKPATQKGGNSGILYGDNRYAFALTAPEGWVLDNNRERNNGLDAVFYPTGSSWAKAKVVMYANTIEKKKGGFAEAVAGDIAEFQQHFPHASVTAGASLTTGEPGKTAMVKNFVVKDKQYDSIAYIDAPKVAVLIVANSGDPKALEATQPAFRNLVASYKYLTTDVHVSGAAGVKTGGK